MKTFVFPKLMFRSSVISVSTELIKEVNSICYNFIWNGSDKVKRNAITADIEKNMLDIESMIRTKIVTCLKKKKKKKKILEDYPSLWKTILNDRLLPVGGSFVLQCNFETSKLNVNLPMYYRQWFEVWSELKAKTPNSFHNIVNEILGTTGFADKKSIYRRDIAELGFLKVRDLISANALAFDCLHLGLNPEQNFFVMRIVSSILSHWRLSIKTSTLPLVIDPIRYDPLVTLESKSFLDVPSKYIYNFFRGKK